VTTPATPPTTWPLRSGIQKCCFPAIMSWLGRPRSSRPPDGALSDYMASLEKLSRRAETLYFPPAHGGAVRDAPRFVQQVHHPPAGPRGIDPQRLAAGDADIPTLVRSILYRARSRLVRAAGCRCWRIWRISPPALVRPTASPRSMGVFADREACGPRAGALGTRPLRSACVL